MSFVVKFYCSCDEWVRIKTRHQGGQGKNKRSKVYKCFKKQVSATVLIDFQCFLKRGKTYIMMASVGKVIKRSTFLLSSKRPIKKEIYFKRQELEREKNQSRI